MTWLLLTVVAVFAIFMYLQLPRRYGGTHHTGNGEDALANDDDFGVDLMVADDKPAVKIVNDILSGVKERGASEVRVGMIERDEQPKGLAALYVHDEKILHRMDLPMEHEQQITRRLRIIAGLDPYASTDRQEGLIRLKGPGIGLQEFRVIFPAADSGGEILLTVQEGTESNNETS